MTTVTFYYSPDCGSCHTLEPEIRKAARKKGMGFKKVNVENCDSDLCSSMGYVPTVYIGKRELSERELGALIDG